MVHRWIFRPTANKTKRQPKKERKKPIYQQFEGRIIRNIIIETKDPFGFSFTDSTEVANSWLEKTGNAIHVKSMNMAVQKFFAAKKKQTSGHPAFS